MKNQVFFEAIITQTGISLQNESQQSNTAAAFVFLYPKSSIPTAERACAEVFFGVIYYRFFIFADGSFSAALK